MAHEWLTLVGSAFWQRLCMEHGIDKDGILEDPSIDGEDRKNAFFYQADDDRYVPRAILVDTEPRVRTLMLVVLEVEGFIYLEL